MTTVIDEVPAPAGSSQPALRVLTVDVAYGADSPVLVFLHGKGQASKYLDEVPFVCTHLSPPFQAILGRLRNVTVVAPQAPHAPDDPWTWSSYAARLREFLQSRFGGRPILASGFSRGGLGILQFIRDSPGFVSKWGIIDPQRAPENEEKDLLNLPGAANNCWLRYGNALAKNTPFAQKLAATLNPASSVFLPEMGHGELALKGYAGDCLNGPDDLYAFLGLEHDAAASQI